MTYYFGTLPSKVTMKVSVAADGLQMLILSFSLKKKKKKKKFYFPVDL